MQIKTTPTQPTPQNARVATLEALIATILKAHLDPVPCKVTLRHWFDAAKIPRIKCNPFAKRGGGPAYYSVSAVEKFLRSRMLPPMTGGSR